MSHDSEKTRVRDVTEEPDGGVASDGVALDEVASETAEPGRNSGLLDHLRGWHAIMLSTSPAFLGLGVYRAWIEIAFVGSFVDFPTQHIAGHDAFDIGMILAMFAMAALSRRISPLHERRGIKAVGLVLLVLATAGGYLSIWHPELAPVLAWPCALAGGVGIAVLILLWSELYACLAPVRICLLYASSLVVGALIIYMYRGFVLAWLPVMTCLLPLISFACLQASYRALPARQHPARQTASFTFPWKPVAVVAIYSFAFGLEEAQSYATFGPHSAPGMVVCAIVIIAAITMLSGRVEFQTIYGTWMPFLSATFLLLAAFLPSGGAPFSFCSNFGYTASEIFVMTMIGSISYHYGVNAVWLFGIERGVRAVAMVGGRALTSALAAVGLTSAPIVVVAVLVATFIVFSEKRLDSMWGVRIQNEESEEAREALQRKRLVDRCAELARVYGLTQREEEVLLLLAEHKTAGDIERELLIANGTVKAHIGHVYSKLGIHSRDELFERVGEVHS